jgi:hypothetical protein
MSESGSEESFQRRVASGPPAVFWGSAALIALIVAMVGFGVGYAVKGNDAENSSKPATKKTTATKKKPAAAASVRTVGTVTAAPTAESVTIRTAKGQTQSIVIAPTTVVRKASKGATSDLTKGARVIFKGKTYTEAAEIIVLPANGRMGTPLTGVASTSVTYKTPRGKSVTIKTTSAAVDRTTTGTVADITKGSTILVQARRTKAGLVAIEIIVLPSGTAFA